MSYVKNAHGMIELLPDTTGMMIPVQCLCGRVYDLAAVEVTARYADATCFTAPCCGRAADDRKWKSLPDFRELTR